MRAFRMQGNHLLAKVATLKPRCILFLGSSDAVRRVLCQNQAAELRCMPLDDYGFRTRFGWVTDRFGVSWQINFGPLK
ncbi:VOC family protein [Rhodopirellula sp. JC639]|uniref:VOC family protein n=1 Tax=Stieleria mannarensis TaxID=2755585 RepID=UPI00336A576C